MNAFISIDKIIIRLSSRNHIVRVVKKMHIQAWILHKFNLNSFPSLFCNGNCIENEIYIKIFHSFIP